MIRWNPNFFPIPNTLDTEPHPVSEQHKELSASRMQQKGCDVIQAEGDADVDIAKAAINMSALRPTSLIGEDTDLLVLLLFHADVSKCTALYLSLIHI